MASEAGKVIIIAKAFQSTSAPSSTLLLGCLGSGIRGSQFNLMGPFWPMTFVFKLHRTGTGKPRLCLGSGFSGNVGRDAGTLLAASGRFGSCLRDRGIAAAGCSSSMHSDRLRVALNCIGEMACGYLLATGLLSASHVFLLDIISPCRASLN